MKNFLENIMLHNAARVTEVPTGFRLSRYPEAVHTKMKENPIGKIMADMSCGIEIRFVSESDFVYLTVTSEHQNGDVTIYLGDYCLGTKQLTEGKSETLKLEKPYVLKDLEEDFYKNNLFGRNVWRLHFHNSRIVINSVDGLSENIRKPKKDELPKKNLLAYGSSITHGAGTMYHPMCYANTFATFMKADILNKGLSGSCLCEPEIADWFSKSDDWDFALLELGVNMTWGRYIEDFEKLVSYFIKTVAETRKPIILPTIYPHSLKIGGEETKKIQENFSEILRNEAYKYENCHIIEGNKILTTSEYLSGDGIHPSTEGHIFMGTNLFNEVKNTGVNI